jgi:hypothetical protein
MAKGKQSSGKTYTSQGKHRNVSKSTLRGMRAMKSSADKLLDKQKAWLEGKNPWITIENPNKEDTSRRFIRVRMSDLNHGSAADLRKSGFIMK